MLALKRIFRNRKSLSSYVCTSNTVQCKKSEESDTGLSKQQEKGEFISTKSSKRVVANKKNIKKARQTKMSQQILNVQFKTDFFKKILAPSVENVAEDLGGNKTQTKQDLLEYIKTFEVSKEQPKQFQYDFQTEVEVRENEGLSSAMSIFKNSKGLNIFPPDIMKDQNQVKLNIWDRLEAEHLEYISLKSPRNYFEELIQWTNEGKLWHFPIDNDQGLEAEAKVSFTEHIFLEQHLEPWCPKKGPLRRFMELVLIGLAKNPYLKVEDKKEHISWFENYFEGKKKLLKELGAVGATKELHVSSQEHSEKD